MTVYLVGAGPGDPGLITVRGAELLAQAEVVVHDRLVDPSLLELAPPTARRIDVGKKPGAPRSQQEISNLLVDLGRSYETVVRLKGGDPFLFGRGGEEVEALLRAGVKVEVVPGITSAFAAPVGLHERARVFCAPRNQDKGGDGQEIRNHQVNLIRNFDAEHCAITLQAQLKGIEESEQNGAEKRFEGPPGSKDCERNADPAAAAYHVEIERVERRER